MFSAGKNVEILKTLTSILKNGENASKKLKLGSMNNILMELRKYVFHVFQLFRLQPLTTFTGAYNIHTLFPMTSSRKD
jgi:hypothetical protein